MKTTSERIVPPVSGRFDSYRDPMEHDSRFEVEIPKRKLSDLVLPEKTEVLIKAMLTKIKHHHLLYDTFGLSEVDPSGGRTAINLYGPPGTGKSMTAEAIAYELGLKMIRVNYSELESKFVGETPKNIKSVFKAAKDIEAMLFFDEADSILGKRLSNITQSTDHAVNVSRSTMLIELDRFTGVTVFATNYASNYDPAFVRRILGHIEMPLPDKNGRRAIFKKHIPSRLPVRLGDDDWNYILSESEGLSGGDILNIVIQASSMAIERYGSECIIGLKDFLEAINIAQKAKREVGVSLKS